MTVLLSNDACPNCVLSRNDIVSMHEKAHQLFEIHHETWRVGGQISGVLEDGVSEPEDITIESSLTIGQYGAGDTKHLTQFGAEAVALQIAEMRKQYYAYDRTAIGTGVDYSLRMIGNQPPPPNSLNFLDPDINIDARMEVSGTTNSDLYEDRVKAKTRQSTRSDHVGTIAFICVVDFLLPKVHFSERRP